MKIFSRGFTLSLIGFYYFAGSASQCISAEKPFYEGKTLTVLINYAPGGPTDVEGRLLARHLARHVSGNPNVVVQNMAGAGGVIGTNYLGQVAKPDGLMMGYFTGALFHQQVSNPALRTDLSKYAFISGIQGITVSYIRSDVPPGIRKPADFMKAQRFKAGGLSYDSFKDVCFRLSFDLLGLKYDYVTGYNSSADARLAVQRNEVQYHDETLPAFRSQVEPSMVKSGQVTPLYYADLIDSDGEVTDSPDVPELLSFTKFYKQIFGSPPSGIKYDALKAANIAGTNMTRAILLPPGSPKEAVAALKLALSSLSKDEEYLADALKVMRFRPRFEMGAGGDRLYQRATQISPELGKFIRQFIEQERK
jgi:tripartite-type tricarboxylate transporter receptor subunit TctC